MSQILHIFYKDARRFWGEIFLSVAITAAFAWFYPNTWIGPDHIHGAMGSHSVASYNLQIMGGFLLALVPVSWWLLIVRVVHAETLVGDRQFWLTRPYEWPKLLAAKLLFLLAFLYLPIFIAQCALLAEAGFKPFSFIPGLLFNLLLLTIVLVLPILAVATVTSNFARMTLTLLGVFVGIIALGAVVQRLMPNHFTAIAGASYTTQGAFTLAFCVCAAVVVLQYALRRVWLARALLYGIPALLILASPFAERIQSHHPRIDVNYPVAANPPVQLAFHPLSPSYQTYETWPDTGEVLIHTPLQGTGVAAGTVLVPDAVKLEVEAPNGVHWVSDWQGTAMPKFFAGSQDGDAVVSIPRDRYEQLKSMPLTMHLSVAFSEARETRVTRMPLPSEDFSIPGFGVCSPLAGFLSPFTQATGLLCRSALRDPPLTYIGVVWSDTPCDAPHPEPDQGVQGAAWVGSLDRAPADLDISSVQQVHFTLSNSIYERSNVPRHLCPGSPVTFTEYERVSRTQTSVTIHDFHLPGVKVSDGQTHVFTTTTTTTEAPKQK
jgi:hypothetical protein